jgi:ADP-ribose pyrophosphatase YjhB (NUDIX family)
MSRPKLGAIAVMHHQGRILLVKRRNEPNANTWGFPGGHVELGETALNAAARELTEETSVIGTPISYLTNIDVITRDAAGDVQFHYLLTAVLCRYESGTPLAADDVSDAGWFAPDAVGDLPQSPNLQTIIDLLDM